MKRLFCLVVGIMILALCGCGQKDDREGKWDCSVVNALEDETVINFSDVEIRTDSGELCFQNRNDFLIHLYLYARYEEKPLVTESDIQPGGIFVFYQVKSDIGYTIGVHADVEEGKSIQVMVYDGDTKQEPYETE